MKVIVLARSGYTTIMDLVRLGKKAFLSHPGQYEQLYLAKKLEERFSTVQNKMILNNLQK
jgi:predicted glycosyltransferase